MARSPSLSGILFGMNQAKYRIQKDWWYGWWLIGPDGQAWHAASFQKAICNLNASLKQRTATT